MHKNYRPFVSFLLVAIAVGVATYYLVKHPKLTTQLAHTSILVSLSVFLLYVVMFVVLMLKFSATIKLCSTKLAQRENAALNAHSLFINFFIPGQGGPVYIAAYLFKKHKLKVKTFILATLVYYAIYAVISIFLLFVGSRPWWQTTIATAFVAAIVIAVVKRYSKRAELGENRLNLSVESLGYLFMATLLQAAVQATIYAIELHSVNRHIGFTQVLTYTGAANLALFVSLTPGAIGIRESFLIFTKRLHHISSANIIVANVIDRSVYLAFLLILLVVVILIEARGRLNLKKLPSLIKQAFGLQKPSPNEISGN